jgi:bacillithiol system protein YtxJ
MASTGNHFHTVADAGTLEGLFERSHEAPVLLFKHSNACPISAAAYQQMARFDGEVSIVVVQDSRELSREIASRTGVQHESPQALVLRNGEAVWTASHFDVTAAAVEQALKENA